MMILLLLKLSEFTQQNNSNNNNPTTTNNGCLHSMLNIVNSPIVFTIMCLCSLSMFIISSSFFLCHSYATPIHTNTQIHIIQNNFNHSHQIISQSSHSMCQSLFSLQDIVKTLRRLLSIYHF